MVKRLSKLDWSQRIGPCGPAAQRAPIAGQLWIPAYGYPPDLSEDATQLVLKQAELSTANAEQY
jgi:type I restriction enzyme, R subunit